MGPRKKPTLRTSDLDLVAGVLPQVVRAPNPIRVIGRQQANKIRHFLCRAHGVKKKKHVTVKKHCAKGKKRPKHSANGSTDPTGAVTVPGGKKKRKKMLGASKSQQGSSGKKAQAQKGSKAVPVEGQNDFLLRKQAESHQVSAHVGQGHLSIVEDVSDEEFLPGLPR